MLTRKQAIDFLKKRPAKYANMLGFDKLTDIHNDWIREMVLGKEDFTLEAHRGSYKTTCVSIAIAETMILLPSLRNLFMRKTDDDVKEIINQVRKILEAPQTQVFVNAIYGINLNLPVSNATELSTNLIIDTKGTSQTVAISANSNLTGRHFDRIFDDDIINVKDRFSRAEREHTKVVYQELRNVLNRGGKMVNTLTPWHKDDASTLMAEPCKYTWKDTGLISPEEIKEIKASMAPSLFAANYELRHIASEDVIFSDPVLHGDPVKVQQARYSHIDAAYGGEDSTAFTICRKAEGKYYVYGKKWRKHVDDCLDMIRAEKARFNARCILCETNADKGYLRKELEDQGERNVITYWEDMNKYLKIVTYLKGVWDRIVFVDGTDQEYIDEILEFNENAEHDDAPDSLASCIRQLWDEKDENDNVSYFGRL